MTFDQNPDTSFYDQEVIESEHNNSADQSDKVKSDDESEKVIHALNNFTSSYCGFQKKVEENKALIKKLQFEIQESKDQKEFFEAELAKMPAPDSLKKQNEGGEVFSDNSDTPSDSSEENEHADVQSEQQHYDNSTDGTAKVVTNNDQITADVSESKDKVKACITIERYIESIKSSIDHQSGHSEAYLQPLNVSCNLLGSQVKHIKLLERLVAVFDEQRSLKTKEKEIHDIIELLTEQLTS